MERLRRVSLSIPDKITGREKRVVRAHHVPGRVHVEGRHSWRGNDNVTGKWTEYVCEITRREGQRAGIESKVKRMAVVIKRGKEMAKPAKRQSHLKHTKWF